MDFRTPQGVRLHYRVDGRDDASAILLSNSLGADLDMWAAQVALLAPRYRVVRYDSRGHGDSDASPGPYEIGQLASDALALLDHLGIERALVCGISMGGLVAQWLAIHHPERLRSAVFANTGAKIGTAETWSERITTVRTEGMVGVRDAVVGRFFTPSFVEREPETVERIRRTLVAVPADAYIASCRAVEGADLRAEVGSIRAPSLIVASTEDVSTPVADSEWLHVHIPGSRLVVIEDAAHLSNVEQPDRFNEALAGFLNEHPS